MALTFILLVNDGLMEMPRNDVDHPSLAGWPGTDTCPPPIWRSWLDRGQVAQTQTVGQQKRLGVT